MDDEMELLGAAFDWDLAGEYAEDELGAIRVPSRYPGARRTRRGRLKRAQFMNAVVPKVPGVPAPGARNFPLGFGTHQFAAGGATAAVLTARPQRPFKGSRLVVSIARAGASATGLVTITQLAVGQNNQLVSAQALPAEGFLPDAFQTVLSLDPATPGIDIVLGIAISAAPTTTDTVDVSAMLIGDTIG